MLFPALVAGVEDAWQSRPALRRHVCPDTPRAETTPMPGPLPSMAYASPFCWVLCQPQQWLWVHGTLQSHLGAA